MNFSSNIGLPNGHELLNGGVGTSELHDFGNLYKSNKISNDSHENHSSNPSQEDHTTDEHLNKSCSKSTKSCNKSNISKVEHSDDDDNDDDDVDDEDEVDENGNVLTIQQRNDRRKNNKGSAHRKSYSKEVKKRSIALRDSGLSVDEISKILDTAKSNVEKWCSIKVNQLHL